MYIYIYYNAPYNYQRNKHEIPSAASCTPSAVRTTSQQRFWDPVPRTKGVESPDSTASGKPNRNCV